MQCIEAPRNLPATGGTTQKISSSAANLFSPGAYTGAIVEMIQTKSVVNGICVS